MVTEERALAPYTDDQGPAAPYIDRPYITVMFQGVPMRFHADGLRGALNQTILAVQATLDDPTMDAKSRVMLGVMRQAAGLIIPLMRPLVKLTRNDPRVPDAVKRILPEVPSVPRHADRTLFLLTYLADVLHGALTKNAYALDVAPDLDADYADVMQIVRFGAADPAVIPHDALLGDGAEGEA